MAEKVEFYRETEFKDTEIGRIPKEWEVVKLGEVCMKIKAGGTPLTSKKEYYEGNIPFVKIEDVTSSYKYLKSTSTTIAEAGLKNSSAWLVPVKSLLVAMYGSIGAIAINEIEVATNQAILAIFPNNEKTNVEFLFYLLTHLKPLLKRHAKQTTQANLTAEIIKNFKVALPKYFEQQRITEILSTVDESIQKTDDIIAKTERLKKGLMQELLTKGIGHEEFKDTEVGRIPKEWEISNLGEVSYLIMGQSPPSKTYNRDMIGLPFLQGQKDFGDMYPNPSVYCSKPIKIAEEGDVLVSVRAPVGDINIATSKLCIGRGLAAIRPDKNQLDAKFIFYQLKHFSARLVDLGSGSTFKAIRRNELERFPTVLPPLSEQQKIASILSTVDEKLETLKQEKVKLKRIKQWFMEELLTGRIRVRIA